MWKQLGLAGIGAIASLPALVNTATAQIGISPLIIEVQENNGQAQATINVINNTNKPFRARVSSEFFTYEKNQGFNTIPANEASLVPYLRFSPRELTVPAGVTRRIRLNVQMPAQLPAGEYRSVIFTENLDQQQRTDQKGAVTNISTRIGVTLFVRRGNHAPKITTTTAIWDAKKSRILLSINNSGKASAYPEINWKLSQAGKNIETGKVNPTGIVPNSDRTVSILPQKLPAGQYQLSGTLTWGEPDKKNIVPFSVDVSIK